LNSERSDAKKPMLIEGGYMNLEAREQRHDKMAFRLIGVLVAVLLSGCNLNPGPTPPPPSPVVGPKALIYGAVSSPVYNALSSKMTFTPNDGSQKPEDYDLMMVDGDSFNGQQIKEDKLIQRAIHSGGWVVGLDMAEDDKQVGLKEIIGASTPKDSRFYMIRQSHRLDKSLVYTIVDPAVAPQTTDQVAQQIVTLVKNHVLSEPDDPSVPPPARLLNVTYRLVRPLDFQLPANKNPVFGGKPLQQASWAVTHSVRVFLDANNNPQGNFQHVLLSTWGTGNPGTPISNTKDACSDNDDQCELAWIQTRFDTTAQFPDGSGLILTDTSPANVNNSETVTTGTNFNIGYNQMQGAFGSFTYSNSTTKTITDWKALNKSTSNAATWVFGSNHPYDGLVSSGYEDSMWFYYWGGVAPQTPNTLSLTSFQYSTQAHWTNAQVSKDVLTISGSDNAFYNDTWTVRDNKDDNPSGNNFYCVWYNCGDVPAKGAYGLAQHWFQYNNSQPWTLNIDMSTVIPVRTKSLTFSPNPVVAGQPTTATLTLVAKTPLDAQVLISSDKPGIAPENNTYTIPAGQDSIGFTVNTGAQGCQPQSATITAYYAEGQNSVLSVNPPPNCP
jgi:hypothetical protein